ncbi:MAG: DUF4396 domain-containing protein [Acidimicrobiales bacterium]
MLTGALIVWFAEAVVSAALVVADIGHTPESPVLKWGFVIVTLYTGPIGLVLYLWSCREPLPGTHEDYVRARWRQVVGSTMHCVAGDGIGILVAAAATARLGLPAWADFLFEYVAGFGFGWTIFQALFMKDMAGGIYGRSLALTFLPEFVSMNALMAGMVAVSVPWRQGVAAASGPGHPGFWFVYCIALTAGFALSYPFNWWLVAAGPKHGMMTVRPDARPVPLVGALALAGAALASPGASHVEAHGSHRVVGHEPSPLEGTPAQTVYLH